MTYPTWPFGPLSKCKHLCVNQWFDLQGNLYPEGLPATISSIDLEWSVRAEGARAIAPLIGSAQDSISGAIYLWLSDRLLNQNLTPRLCVVGPKVRTLRAHNVEADRTKVWESHEFIEPIAWECTLSTHVLLSGHSSGQSFLMRKAKSEGSNAYKPWFMGYTSMKNIVDVHNFWVQDSEAEAEDKVLRDIFYKGSMEDIRANFQQLMSYSIRDAIWVNEIAQEQEVALKEAMPSEIRHEARGIRGNVSLSLAPWFDTWLESCESQYQALTQELNALARDLLKARALEFKQELQAALETYEEIPPELRTKKGKGPIMAKYRSPWALNLKLNPRFQIIVDQWARKYKTRKPETWVPNCQGFPKWSQALEDLSYESPLVQDLADLIYFGQQVVYDPVEKFCFVDKDTGVLARVFSPKKGPATKDNCGSLFGIDFIPLFEDGSLYSELPLAQEIVTKAAELSYWTSVRARMHKISLQKQLAEQHLAVQTKNLLTL